MKDKLVKTGHKKAYYRFRSFGIALLALLGIGLASSLPVLVTYSVCENAALAKEAEQKEEDASVEEEGFFPVEIDC